MSPDLVASFFTLSGAGFGEPARTPFAERCRAAAAAGFTGIGLHVDEFDRLQAAGVGAAEVEAILAANGLRLVEIEFLSGWAVEPDPAAVAATEQRLYRLADLFGGHHVSTGEFGPPAAAFDLERAAERLAGLARRAGEHGLRLALEAFPWSAIGDVRTALRLLDLAGAPNAGLMIDVWHFFNCGAVIDELRGLSPGRIAALQLNDGPLVHGDFLWNARNTRQLPGDGELNVVGLVRRLDEIGFTGPYCVEVNFPAFRRLPVEQAAERAFDKAAAVLRQARSGLPR